MILVWSLSPLVFAQNPPAPGGTELVTNRCGEPDKLPYTEGLLEQALRKERCPRQWSKVEQYVLQKIGAKKVVDLTAQGPLSGCFLSQLLALNPNVPAAGIDIRNAIIIGPVDLRNREVKHEVEFTNCEFQDVVDLKRSHFDKRLSFHGCDFLQRVDAESAIIDVDLIFDDCEFQDCQTFLRSLHVGGDLRLDNSKFAGVVDFSQASISGDFRAENETEFHQGETDPSNVDPKWAAADFENMKVSGATVLSTASFYGYAGFGDAHFANLFLDGAHFYGDTSFTRTKLDGLFLQTTDFRAAKSGKQLLTIDEMTFQDMSPASWDRLRGFAEATTYNAEFYAKLEASFRRREYPGEATEVYIAGQERKREDLGSKFNAANTNWDKAWPGVKWLGNFAFDWSLGYGRHLERALYAGIVVLLLGWWFAFRKEAWMRTQDPKATDCEGKYRGFWYSLDLFLPVVDFGDEDTWTPREERRKSAFYRRIHMILGHILVPLGLAAMTLKEIIK
jgi:uncharacterized protein YjbI with pentapeptide repeats